MPSGLCGPIAWPAQTCLRVAHYKHWAPESTSPNICILDVAIKIRFFFFFFFQALLNKYNGICFDNHDSCPCHIDYDVTLLFTITISQLHIVPLFSVLKLRDQNAHQQDFMSPLLVISNYYWYNNNNSHFRFTVYPLPLVTR